MTAQSVEAARVLVEAKGVSVSEVIPYGENDSDAEPPCGWFYKVIIRHKPGLLSDLVVSAQNANDARDAVARLGLEVWRVHISTTHPQPQVFRYEVRGVHSLEGVVKTLQVNARNADEAKDIAEKQGGLTRFRSVVKQIEMVSPEQK